MLDVVYTQNDSTLYIRPCRVEKGTQIQVNELGLNIRLNERQTEKLIKYLSKRLEESRRIQNV